MDIAFGGIKFLIFIVLAITALGIFAANFFAGRKSSKLVNHITNGKVNLEELTRELYFTAGSKRVSEIPPDNEILNSLSRVNTFQSYSTTYDIKLVRQVAEGQFLLIVNCRYMELVSEKKEETRLAVYLFLLKADRSEKKHTVYSEVYSDLTDKTQREQFAIELLSL